MLGCALAMALATETSPSTSSQARLEIRPVLVGGNPVPFGAGEAVRLPAFPENIAFRYGAAHNSSRIPIRLRYKLEGFDPAWRESCGQMFLAIRFLDEAGEQVARTTWNVSGESPGWSGRTPVGKFHTRFRHDECL